MHVQLRIQHRPLWKVSLMPRSSPTEFLAQRREIKLNGAAIATTPLLVPSFSSKGFPQVGKIMKLMGEFITGPILVSACDIYHKEITQKITFSELIFLDSGGYEARYDHNLSEAYGKLHKPRPWNRRFHESTLRNWSSKWPTIAVTYDSPAQFQNFGDQVKAARESRAGHSKFLWELLLKPETKKDKFIGVEKAIKHVHQLRDFAVVGMTEKEIDDSLFGAMNKIARLRAAMDSADIRAPIHIFGFLLARPGTKPNAISVCYGLANLGMPGSAMERCGLQESANPCTSHLGARSDCRA